jgi:serine/tyrosine/threonine adenylyltransferase
VEREDFAPFEDLLEVLKRPFDEQPAAEHYAEAPRAEERVLETFCGT